jgi:hypothetical protein
VGENPSPARPTHRLDALLCPIVIVDAVHPERVEELVDDVGREESGGVSA